MKNIVDTLLASLCIYLCTLSAYAANTSVQSKAKVTVSDARLKIPDVKLFNQYGEPVNFYSDLVKNKTVAINFIFTSCGMTCPLLGYKFGQLQASLGDKAGSEVHLISVTIDPVNDTPEKLKNWAKPFNNGKGWTLVTGSKQDVDHLLKALETFAPDTADHSTLVLMGNEGKGEWKRVDGLSSADTLKEALSDWLTE